MAKQNLGKLETQFFAYVQMREKQTVQTGEIAEALNLDKNQEGDLLSRLAKGGLIARVRPGLYLTPEKLPAGGSWTPDEILALNTLMKDCGGTYQICGPNAFNRYGWVNQVPNKIYAYNDKISGERKIGANEFSLIKVAKKRLGGTVQEITKSDQKAVYSSKTRALIDAIYDWSRFNSLPEGYQWAKHELRREQIDPSDLIKTAIDYGNMGTLRRLGYLLEVEGISDNKLEKLEKEITSNSSFIPWDPVRPKRGTTNKRWGIVDNRGEN